MKNFQAGIQVDVWGGRFTKEVFSAAEKCGWTQLKPVSTVTMEKKRKGRNAS